MPLEPGWDDAQLLRLFYRTPDHACLELKVLQMGGDALIHWAVAGGVIQSAEVPMARYVTAEGAGVAAYEKARLQELVATFARGLELAAQVRSWLWCAPPGLCGLERLPAARTVCVIDETLAVLHRYDLRIAKQSSTGHPVLNIRLAHRRSTIRPSASG